MISNNKSFSAVLDILCSGLTSLKDLADLSGRDPFTFYRQADLRNLDLSNQNLVGLDFRGADLRGSDLSNSKIEKGSLNNSKIDEKYLFLTDEYDSSMSDFISIFDRTIYCYAKFRPHSLDNIFDILRMPFSEFCGKYDVSQSTLRKARRGLPIMTTTCLEICGGITSEIETRFSLLSIPPHLTERCDITIGHFVSGKQWTRASRSEYVELSIMAEAVNSLFARYQGGSPLHWYRGPETIIWQYNYYIVGNPEELPLHPITLI